MTLGGRLIALFPLMYLILNLVWIQKMLIHPRPWDFPALLAILYVLPLVCYRLHFFFFPFSDGQWDLSERKYNPWWASHVFQMPFIAVPWLESLLILVPGLFSMWLRAWGSQIGKKIYWTPRVEILDRGLVEIGDHVVFGHLSILVSHMVADIDSKPMLIIKKIKIGDRAFIGADSQIGPGAVIEPRAKLKPKTRIFWRGHWP